MSALDNALQLAVTAHADQVDKAGQPYILHPLRVMQAMKTDPQRIVAILHDVVEDTSETVDSLRRRGFSEEILDAIAALTKKDGEDYFEFVARAASNGLARPVKIADIRDNLDSTRIASPTKNDHDRMARYRRALKLAEAIGLKEGDEKPTAPTILPLRESVSKEEVEAECPGEGDIYACDFKIDGAEVFEHVRGVLKTGRVWNVDHHADLPGNQKHITSTCLATNLLREHKPGRLSRVVINHTDCDSVLSSALMMGLIEPHPDFETASVHADHTGEAHTIADLLQGLDETRSGNRTEEQYLESVRNLKLLRADEPLEPAGAAALAARVRDRKTASEIARSSRMQRDGGVAYVRLDEEIDGSLFLPFLPGASVLMITLAHPGILGNQIVKLRVGPAAPKHLSLHQLSITHFDPAYGGRWNAGSNKRGGGTTISERDYLHEVVKRIDRD